MRRVVSAFCMVALAGASDLHAGARLSNRAKLAAWVRSAKRTGLEGTMRRLA
jgi:hypothetical protein